MAGGLSRGVWRDGQGCSRRRQSNVAAAATCPARGVIPGVKRSQIEPRLTRSAFAIFGSTRRKMAPAADCKSEAARFTRERALVRNRAGSRSRKARPAGPPSASLGAAEAVVRREVVAGRAEEFPRLLPYGATVAFLGQAEALRVSRRERELCGGALGGRGQSLTLFRFRTQMPCCLRLPLRPVRSSTFRASFRQPCC